MNSGRHPDPVASETPKPHLGNIFLLAGAIIAPCAVAVVALTSLEPWLHDVLLFGPGLILIVGVVAKIAERVVAANTRHVAELMRQQALADAVKVQENGQLAAQLQANNHLLRTLTAQPTVRLVELRREMREALERMSREGIRQITEHVDKAVERGVQDGAVAAAREVASIQRAGAAEGVVDLDDVRLLKRLEERVRGSNPEQ
jgi:hypothetical protein